MSVLQESGANTADVSTAFKEALMTFSKKKNSKVSNQIFYLTKEIMSNLPLEILVNHLFWVEFLQCLSCSFSFVE